MHRHYFIIIVIIALLCLLLVFFSLAREIAKPITKNPPTEAPHAPFKSYISGVGIVEANSENIAIGTSLHRVVNKIFVTVGSKVKRGDPLFQMENRDLQANLAVQEAAYQSAIAKLKRLESFPHPQDLSAAESAEKSAKVAYEQAKQQYQMVLDLKDPRAISLEEKNRRMANFREAEAKWNEAQATLKKVKAGTWKPDLDIANLDVVQAKATVNQIKTEIQRTIVRSPLDGAVLQIKIHEGEILPQDVSKPAMLIGNTDELFLRVNINQLDIPFFRENSPATAFLQGDSHYEFPLEFVRIEPYLVTKQFLTNDVTEKVDTRVLQIIYRIKKEDPHLIVGQQMDVFIKAKPLT